MQQEFPFEKINFKLMTRFELIKSWLKFYLVMLPKQEPKQELLKVRFVEDEVTSVFETEKYPSEDLASLFQTAEEHAQSRYDAQMETEMEKEREVQIEIEKRYNMHLERQRRIEREREAMDDKTRYDIDNPPLPLPKPKPVRVEKKTEDQIPLQPTPAKSKTDPIVKNALLPSLIKTKFGQAGKKSTTPPPIPLVLSTPSA